MRRSTSVVLIERYQYLLVDPRGGDLQVGPGDGFGLLNLLPSRDLEVFLVVQTGSPWGALGLGVEVHEAAPEPILDPWDEVVEVSIRSESGELAFATAESGMMSVDNLLAGDDVLGVAVDPLTWCRVRVHARGRDAGNEYVATVPEPPVEEHLVQIWPAAPTPTAAHKLTDGLGQRARARATPGVNGI